MEATDALWERYGINNDIVDAVAERLDAEVSLHEISDFMDMEPQKAYVVIRMICWACCEAPVEDVAPKVAADRISLSYNDDDWERIAQQNREAQKRRKEMEEYVLEQRALVEEDQLRFEMS